MGLFRKPFSGLALLALLSGAARAQPVPAPPQPPAPSSVAGWDALLDDLRGLPDRMLARLPENQRNDPQIQQEVARRALQALGAAVMDAGADGDVPEFLPSWGMQFNIAQPNADTIYRMTRITPGGQYRLTGRRGTAPLAVVSQAVPASARTATAWPELDLSKVAVDKDGRYDVLLSPERPPGYRGDWWRLSPGVNRLMLRFISSDWAKDVAPTISIERLDRPMRRDRENAASLERRLRSLPGYVESLATLQIQNPARLRADGYLNRFKATVPHGALGRQSNYEGAFELADGEALIIEVKQPAACEYMSLLLIDDLYQTIDWYNNQSALNGDQVSPDKDGMLRVVVSAEDPGVRNWLDTAGHHSGVVKGRWTGCDTQLTPNVRKVKVAELPSALPADTARVTPAERDAIVRARRRAMLERQLW